MRIFICGGGDSEKTILANKKLNEIIDHNKPILYVPLAMDENKHPYDNCFDWVKNELKNVNVNHIEMVRTFEEFASKNYYDYSAIFIGGGNTFKLLKGIKETDAYVKLKEYINNNGIVFGGSAGAIILGQCIDTCKYADKNEVDLKDQIGLDVASYYSFLCHYTNQDNEKTKLNRQYLLELSKYEKIIALPEEVTLYIHDGIFEILGDQPFYIYEDGNEVLYNNVNNRIKEFNMIKTENELMDFMNKNITYGWQEPTGELHFNNLTNFRRNYRVNSIERALSNGLGTCIEQAKIIKSFFDRIGLENKLFCHRGYESEENLDKDIRMHCFVLFKYNNIWYHFEHSNRPKRGIKPYENIDQAIADITSGFEKQDIRVLTEIPNIPDNITFKELNEYVNSFDEIYKKVK